MPHKNSGKEKRTPPVILRRSPRFKQIVLSDPEDPKTPNPVQHWRTRSVSSATPISLTGISPRRRSNRSKSKQCSQKLDESCNPKQKSVSSKRLNRGVDECKEEKLPRSSDRRNGNLEKRVTRSSCRDLHITTHSSSSGKCQSPNNKVKHSKKSHDSNLDQFNTSTDDDKRRKPVLSITENRVPGYELFKKDGDKVKNRVDVTTAVVMQGSMNVTDVDRKRKIIGVKRTRNQFENIATIAHGWTEDQELALERAYLEAKPTPHFWKKVSRLVPGKSAQECFDKIHGSHLTPPQPRIRSRARVSNPQSSVPASNLLNKLSPTTKKSKSRKQKSYVIQRTVRHMLQNQYRQEQDSESDVFSLLEPAFSPSLNLNVMLTTPDRTQEPNDAHKRCSTVSRTVTRFSSSYQTTLVSPLVLKQVKNKALHEKYIDLLNCREANRKAASSKAGKVNKSDVVRHENSVERKVAVKAAKNALVFGAKDAISEFEHQQATALNDFFDCESGDADDDDKDNDQVF